MEQRLAMKGLITSSPEEEERSCRSSDLIHHRSVHAQTEDEDCFIQSASHTEARVLSTLCRHLMLCHVLSPSGLGFKAHGF
ncbi:uncharacterized [Tachysurus ichikawai]